MLNISLYPLNTVKRTEYMDSYCMNEKFFKCERTGGVTTKRIPMDWLGDGFKVHNTESNLVLKQKIIPLTS